MCKHMPSHEGEVETNFLYSPVQMPKFKGVKHDHQQFTIFLAFKVQSAEDYKEEFVNTSTAQYLGTFEESEDKEEEQDEFGGMDE